MMRFLLKLAKYGAVCGLVVKREVRAKKKTKKKKKEEEEEEEIREPWLQHLLTPCDIRVACTLLLARRQPVSCEYLSGPGT
nr:hypothetical protein BaRGS_025569 [Batillaria attramentaria]